MPTSTDTQYAVLVETIDAAIGRYHGDDPVLPRTGGPAGNARLTAWIGLALLALLLIESATLISMSSLLVVHIFVGAFLVPFVLLKTATTAWRMLRYYRRTPTYVESGPPPLLLRVLGPLVVIGALAVLGTGLALIALGSASRDPIFSALGFRVDAITLHQAAFVLWLATTGLHVLGRFVPALQLSQLLPADRSTRAVPGAGARLGLVGLTVATATVTGVFVLNLSDWWVG